MKCGCMVCGQKMDSKDAIRFDAVGRAHGYVCPVCRTAFGQETYSRHTEKNHGKMVQMNFQAQNDPIGMVQQVAVNGWRRVRKFSLHGVEWQTPVYTSLCGIAKQYRTVENSGAVVMRQTCKASIRVSNEELMKPEKNDIKGLFVNLSNFLNQNPEYAEEVFGTPKVEITFEENWICFPSVRFVNSSQYLNVLRMIWKAMDFVTPYLRGKKDTEWASEKIMNVFLPEEEAA